MRKQALIAGLTLLASFLPSFAQPTQFDLAGPTLEVRVERGGRTLPISEVPTLAEGDRIWLHPVFGPDQSARYLMVAAFLRGATNPPPENWFTRAQTWTKPIEQEGIYITVPAGAEQVIVFLAPQTGGDFSTLKNAVRGRPGSFVRASQDLNEASLDRARLDTYLAAVKSVTDPAQLKDVSVMLARSLSLKLDQQCFDKQSEQQAPCLLQNEDQLILDNGRSQTATSALVNGPAGDLALQAGSTPQGNYGFYNGYVAAAMDIARILDTMHTAQYQYIPALASEQDAAMHLKLNAPPSFHNPKSVLVIALPPVASAGAPTLEPPALHPVDAKQVYCIEREPLVLPVEGAPPAFATDYAHGLTLHIVSEQGGSGGAKTIDLPARPDPARGGFVIPTSALASAGLSGKISAGVRGYWGFDPYDGPTFKLAGDSADAAWKLADADRNALVVGRDDELHLTSEAAACVDGVTFKDAFGKEDKAEWKLTRPDEITARLPLKDAKPGEITLEIKQAGIAEPETLKLASLSEAARLESFTVHAGDATGTLKGTRLDEVASLTLPGPGSAEASFSAGKLSRSGSSDELAMNSAGPIKSAPGTLLARVLLKDGRTLEVPVAIAAPRPQLTLLNKSVQPGPGTEPTSLGTIQLTNPDELPLTGRLTFAVKAPVTFSRDEGIEIATEDGLASTTFSIDGGELTLQDARTAIATLDPAKQLGNSAFGALRFRPVLAGGANPGVNPGANAGADPGANPVVGDWQPLATLVRLPVLRSFQCPAADAAGHDPGRASGRAAGPAQNSDPTSGSASSPTSGQASGQDAPCTLSGDNLFLLDSVAVDENFTHAVAIPEGFAATSVQLPQGGTQLYLKLRDDPSVVNTVALPVVGQGAQASSTSRSAASAVHP